MVAQNDPLEERDSIQQNASSAGRPASDSAAEDPDREANAPIRVLVASLSGILLELITNLLQQQPDMQLVGVVQGQVNILLAATGVDVLILGAPQVAPLPGICSHLLSEFPHLKILVVTPNGEAARVYWLGLRRQRLGPLSAARLVTEIRLAYAVDPTA